MSDYNGFTGEERNKGGRIQTWAYKRGFLVRPLNCTACGVYGDVPGEIIAHLEDYSEPITGAIFLCVRCHSMVHLRFSYLSAWNDYRAAVSSGAHWPLARNKWTVVDAHCRDRLPMLGDGRVQGPPKGRTVLDDIHDGLLHPGPRSAWGEKMDRIMNNERAYEIPSDQLTLI
jgi:hypothetical protein